MSAAVFPIQPNQNYTFVMRLYPLEGKGGMGRVEVFGPNFTVRSEPFDTALIQRKRQKAKASADKRLERD